MVQPYLEETFVGDGQTSTYLRRGKSTRIRTSETKTLGNATFATTDPRLFEASADQARLEQFQNQVRLVRYGTDCYQYVMLAMGLLDVVIENQLNAWDIQPLVPIVRGAGGIVTNWEGTDDLSTGEVIATANASLHEQVLAAWQAL